MNVTTGRATIGAAGTVLFHSSITWSLLIRRCTPSWATMIAPEVPRFSLPPVWSPCQCVFTTHFSGWSVSAPAAATMRSVSGAN